MQASRAFMCEGCGYDVGSLPLSAPCPECGLVSEKRLSRWPGIAPILWQLVRVQLLAAAVELALFIGMGAVRSWGWRAAFGVSGSVVFVGGLTFILLLIIWPAAEADRLTSRHQPRRSRGGAYVGLLLLGWLASLLIGVLTMVLLAASALLIGLAS